MPLLMARLLLLMDSGAGCAAGHCARSRRDPVPSSSCWRSMPAALRGGDLLEIGGLGLRLLAPTSAAAHTS